MKGVWMRFCSRCKKVYYTLAPTGKVCNKCNKNKHKLRWECDNEGNKLE